MHGTASDNSGAPARGNNHSPSLPGPGDKEKARDGLTQMKALSKADINVCSVLIKCFNHKTGQCNPSIEYIMGWTDLSRSSVFRALVNLKKAGLIERVHGLLWPEKGPSVQLRDCDVAHYCRDAVGQNV